MSEVFDLERVREELKQIAQEFPDRVAPVYSWENPSYSKSCRYIAPDGEPSCIIGVLLDRLGFNREEIKALDVPGYNAVPLDSESKRGLWKRFTPQAIRYMGCVQSCQDRAAPWEQAVARAEERLETL